MAVQAVLAIPHRKPPYFFQSLYLANTGIASIHKDAPSAKWHALISHLSTTYFQIKRKPPLTVYIWLSNTILYWNVL